MEMNWAVRAAIRTTAGLSIALLAACQSPVPGGGSGDASKAELEQTLQAWAAAFNSCEADKVLALYAPEAVLWGTASPVLLSTPAGLRQYFERTCSANPKPKVSLGEHLIRTYGGMALDSGNYVFTVFPGGQPREFPARFSFAYQRQGDKWLIVDHHSSAVPAPPAPAPAASAAR